MNRTLYHITPKNNNMKFLGISQNPKKNNFMSAKQIEENAREINRMYQQQQQHFKASSSTTGEVLIYDGENPEIGMSIFLLKGNEKKILLDGIYTLLNGKTLTVNAGKITDIKQGQSQKMKSVNPKMSMNDWREKFMKH